MKKSLAFITIGTVLIVACGGGETVTVDNARIGEPTGPNAALYFTVSSHDGDTLIGASTTAATAVNLHETRVDTDGTMAMVLVPELDVPAGGELILEPGSFHLMLIDVDHSIKTGDSVEVTLNFVNAGEISIDAEVVDPADTVGNDS